MSQNAQTNDAVRFISQQVKWIKQDGVQADFITYPVAGMAPKTIAGTLTVENNRFQIITGEPAVPGGPSSISVHHVLTGNWAFFNSGINSAGQADYLTSDISPSGEQTFSDWVRQKAPGTAPIAAPQPLRQRPSHPPISSRQTATP